MGITVAVAINNERPLYTLFIKKQLKLNVCIYLTAIPPTWLQLHAILLCTIWSISLPFRVINKLIINASQVLIFYTSKHTVIIPIYY